MLKVYSVAIFLYAIVAKILSLFNSKIEQWVLGQKIWRVDLAQLRVLQEPIWFHCASVGEFEQARPLIEAIRAQFPDISMVITFYSPSGYKLRRDYGKVDLVTYMPLDLKVNALRFLDALNPRAVIFVKYELWFNFMDVISKRKIPFVLVCAHFQKDHWISKPYARYFAKRLMQFDKIFLQDKLSANVLNNYQLNNLKVAGDTRFERVQQVALAQFNDDVLIEFATNSEVLVAGSTWMSDIEVLIPVLEANRNLKIIVAPHELTIDQQNKWKSYYKSEMLRYSELSGSINSNVRLIYIDCIGLLSKLYRLATYTYVGGGFGYNVHNTLEAAVYGKPVFFGPKNKRFAEIQSLKAIGAGFEIQDGADFVSKLNSLTPELRIEIKSQLAQYFQANIGAVQTILHWMVESEVLEHKKTPSKEEV